MRSSGDQADAATQKKASAEAASTQEDERDAEPAARQPQPLESAPLPCGPPAAPSGETCARASLAFRSARASPCMRPSERSASNVAPSAPESLDGPASGLAASRFGRAASPSAASGSVASPVSMAAPKSK
jgi:hypothetical protein